MYTYASIRTVFNPVSAQIKQVVLNLPECVVLKV